MNRFATRLPVAAAAAAGWVTRIFATARNMVITRARLHACTHDHRPKHEVRVYRYKTFSLKKIEPKNRWGFFFLNRNSYERKKNLKKRRLIFPEE